MAHVCMTIEQLKRHINENPDLPRPAYFSPPDRLAAFWHDPWIFPQKDWFAFNSDSVEGCRQALDTLLESLGAELESTHKDFKEYYRLQTQQRRGKKPLTSEEQDSLVQLGPSYKRGKKLKHAKDKLQKAQEREAAKESEWRRELLPKDSNNALCDKVVTPGITYTHQCIFCRKVFNCYPKCHMRYCHEQRKAPASILRAYFSERRDFIARCYDCTDDYKTKILPRREDYRLVKIVLIGEYISMVAVSDSDVPIREVMPNQEFTHQCQFCKMLFRGFSMWWEHLDRCKVRINDHQRNRYNFRRFGNALYTTLESACRKDKETMTKERYTFLLNKSDARCPSSLSMKSVLLAQETQKGG